MFLWCFGFKISLKLLSKWPAFILLPAFTPFAFYGKTIEDRKCLVFSQKWTLINFLFTALCIITGSLLHYVFALVNNTTTDFLSVHDFLIASFGSCILYIWSYASYVLFIKLKRGNLYLKHSLIHKTVLDVETMEEFELENQNVTEKIDIGVQTSIVVKTVKNSEVICKDIAIQTESRKDLTKKSIEFLSLVELAEAFN